MIKANIQKRSRRLRKKLHVDEFKELAFKYSVKYKHPLTKDKENLFVDDLLDEIVKHGLEMTGWAYDGIILRFKGSTTVRDQATIEAWLKSRPDVASVKIGPLFDSWYDIDEALREKH